MGSPYMCNVFRVLPRLTGFDRVLPSLMVKFVHFWEVYRVLPTGNGFGQVNRVFDGFPPSLKAFSSVLSSNYENVIKFQ